MDFWKKDKQEKKGNKTEATPAEFNSVGTAEVKEASTAGLKVSPKELGVLRGFYVSEKASAVGQFNQYVFKVFDNATKGEIKKQVEKNFNVKVGSVRTVNLPKKARSLGRYSGFKKGLKKAIVTLKEGYSIEQAKA